MSKFKFSNRNKPAGCSRWLVFYYTMGMGFETGNIVYYGKNEWNTEADAIASQERHEANNQIHEIPTPAISGNKVEVL